MGGAPAPAPAALAMGGGGTGRGADDPSESLMVAGWEAVQTGANGEEGGRGNRRGGSSNEAERNRGEGGRAVGGGKGRVGARGDKGQREDVDKGGQGEPAGVEGERQSGEARWRLQATAPDRWRGGDSGLCHAKPRLLQAPVSDAECPVPSLWREDRLGLPPFHPHRGCGLVRFKLRQRLGGK